MPAPSSDEKETQELKREIQAISDFVQSDGWKYIKRMFLDEVVSLGDLTNLGDNVDTLALEVASNKKAIEALMNFVAKVEGTKNVQEQYTQVAEVQKEEIIKQIPD